MASPQDLQVMSPTADALMSDGTRGTRVPSGSAALPQPRRSTSPRSPPLGAGSGESMRSEPYPGTLIAHTSAVDVSSSSVELSPSVRADLMSALRRAEAVPVPDTTPPEERQRREANRLRAQLESTRTEANAVLRDQHETHLRKAVTGQHLEDT